MVILFIAVVFFIFGFVVISGDWFLFENILYLSEMRVLTEYEVAKILNKTENKQVKKKELFDDLFIVLIIIIFNNILVYLFWGP